MVPTSLIRFFSIPLGYKNPIGTVLAKLTPQQTKELSKKEAKFFGFYGEFST
jgi:hypothetical protein